MICMDPGWLILGVFVGLVIGGIAGALFEDMNRRD